jgi:hypothetical protein
LNTVADKSVALHQLISGPEIEDETLNIVRNWRAISRSKWRIVAKS